MNEENYNEELVYYCSRCLSLAIKSEIQNLDYCDSCGCTNIATTDINDWEYKYKTRYGFDYVKKKKNKF